jgi:hypothetical protein
MVMQALWKMCWHVEEREQGLSLVTLNDSDDEVAVQTSEHSQAGDEVERRVEAVGVVGEDLPGEPTRW